MNHMLEAYNYHNDPRTRARDGNDWYNSFDPDAMTVTVTVYDNDNGDEVTRTLPAQYVVCPLCEGKGSHVNPSIDCGASLVTISMMTLTSSVGISRVGTT